MKESVRVIAEALCRRSRLDAPRRIALIKTDADRRRVLTTAPGYRCS